MKLRQKNFRLSEDSIQLLTKIAAETNSSQTEVIEHCLARYAAELRIDVERAKSVLLDHFTKMVSASQSNKRSP